MHDTPVPNYWLFEYCINLQPITVGQSVVLYHMAGDCFNPDPSHRAVVEAQIVGVVEHTPYWVVFLVLSPQGVSVGLGVLLVTSFGTSGFLDH